MTRPDDDDDYHDGSPPQTKKGFSAVVWLLLIGGVLLLVVVGLVCGGFLLFSTRAERQAGAELEVARQREFESMEKSRIAATVRIWKESDLRQAVMGKTATEVKALLGPPDEATGDPDATTAGVSLIYYNRLIDPQGTTETARVFFRNGKATGGVR